MAKTISLVVLAALAFVCAPMAQAQQPTRAEAARVARILRQTPLIGHLADHIDHVAGHDHVGIGSDHDGVTYLPEGMGGVEGYPVLFAELIRRGWSDRDLAKLAGGSLLRALREVERVAARR